MGANCVLGRDDELIRSILTIQIYICNVFETLNWIRFYGIQKEKVKHVADYFEAWKYSSEKKIVVPELRQSRQPRYPAW